MDKDLEEIQNFANNLNRKPEERPACARRNLSAMDEMFKSGTKKVKSKIQVLSTVSMVLGGGTSKKN